MIHEGSWKFVNQTLATMKDVTENRPVPINSMVELIDGKQILLSSAEGGRLVQVQMVGGSGSTGV